MTRVNQLGQPVEEQQLFGYVHTSIRCYGPSPTDDERDVAISLLAERLGVEIVRTNATKRGNTEIILRETT